MVFPDAEFIVAPVVQAEEVKHGTPSPVPVMGERRETETLLQDSETQTQRLRLRGSESNEAWSFGD